MSKISSYGIVSPPVAGDIVIGTDVSDANKTKNFRVEDIAALTPIPTLSSVLTAGNTASNNISLIGTLSITGNSVFNGNNQFGPTGTTDFGHLVEFDAITLEGTVRDGASSVGTSGQVLSSTGSGVAWVDSPVYNLPAHADQAAAIAAGLAAGALYQTDGTGAAPLNAAGIVIVVQ